MKRDPIRELIAAAESLLALRYVRASGRPRVEAAVDDLRAALAGAREALGDE